MEINVGIIIQLYWINVGTRNIIRIFFTSGRKSRTDNNVIIAVMLLLLLYYELWRARLNSTVDGKTSQGGDYNNCYL